jgi:hypothetical protein
VTRGPDVCRSLLTAVTLAAIGVAPGAPAAAQVQAPAADTAGALAVVHRLFDAMRAGDSASVRATFHPEAQLATAAISKDGTPRVDIDTVDAFVRAVGTPHNEVWDERLSNERVLLDGPLAVVWADYSFYAGIKFSHCGVDAFELARAGADWKIVSIVDTRRRQGCAS